MLDAVEQEILSHRENANYRWMYGHSDEGDITNAPRTTIPVPRKNIYRGPPPVHSQAAFLSGGASEEAREEKRAAKRQRRLAFDDHDE